MLAALLPLLSPVLGKLLDMIPDPEARRKAEAEAMAMLSTQSHEIARAVLEVNRAEAGHSSVFVAGWRPSVGWACSAAFAYHFVMQPAMTFGLAAAGLEIPPLPTLDMQEIVGVLFALLGMGGLRSWEKAKGVAR